MAAPRTCSAPVLQCDLAHPAAPPPCARQLFRKLANQSSSAGGRMENRRITKEGQFGLAGCYFCIFSNTSCQKRSSCDERQSESTGRIKPFPPLRLAVLVVLALVHRSALCTATFRPPELVCLKRAFSIRVLEDETRPSSLFLNGSSTWCRSPLDG